MFRGIRRKLAARVGAAVAALVVVAGLWGTYAVAVQGTGCLPTSGQYTGVDFASRINAAIAALISSNSGTNPPSTDCSAGPVAGQVWYDTSTSGVGRLAIYDGNTWLGVGFQDANNHIWEPQIGGGLATLASAGTTNLCSKNESSLNITGNAYITQFASTCAIGQNKILTFSGGATLANGTTMLLPSRSNIVTTPGDTAVASYTGGGIWNIVSYTRANGTAIVPSVPPVHYAGQTIMMRMPSCPDGSFPEDGRALSRSSYPQLFANLGGYWGAGDGSTTFNIPYSGGFVDRGWLSGDQVDAGRGFGSQQGDQVGSHQHGVSIPFSAGFTANGTTEGFNLSNFNNQGITSGNNGNVNRGVAGNVSLGVSVSGTVNGGVNGATQYAGGNETRMKNITVYHCIFYANSP